MKNKTNLNVYNSIVKSITTYVPESNKESLLALYITASSTYQERRKTGLQQTIIRDIEEEILLLYGYVKCGTGLHWKAKERKVEIKLK